MEARHMNDRQRRGVFAVILIISVVVVAYLVFFSPSETTIDVPTPTVGVLPTIAEATSSYGAREPTVRIVSQLPFPIPIKSV
jgi:hypothetical protein